MSHFSSSKKVTVGLDIENDSVKMVKLRHTREGPKLVGFGVAELPPGEKRLSGTEKREISSTIKKILPGEKVNGHRVISSISGPSVHVQVSRFPSLPAKKLREAIRWRVKEKAPFDLEQATLDYSILDELRDNRSEKLNTIAVLAENKVIQEKMDLLTELGLKSLVMDVVPLALLNSFKVGGRWKKNEVIALVNVEVSTTHLAIVKDAKLEFSREIALGSHPTIQGPQERTNLWDPESAQKMRGRSGIVDENSDKDTEKSPLDAIEKVLKVSPITKRELEKLVRDLRLSFHSYRAQFLEERIDRIDRIVLSGSLAQLDGFDKFLAASLEIPVEIGNPLDKIPLDSHFKKERYQNLRLLSPSLNIATGLALGKGEGINLSPDKEKAAQSARRMKAILLPSLYFAGLFVLLASGHDFLNQRAAVYEQELQSKKGKITVLNPKLERVETLMRDVKRWNRRYTSIIPLRESSIPWVPVLARFSESIPEEAWLRELSFVTSPTDTDQKKDSSLLMITGSMKGEKLVANLSLMEFISQLEKSSYFDDVYLLYTDENNRYGQKVIDFTIAAHLPRKGQISSSTHGSGETVERSGSS